MIAEKTEKYLTIAILLLLISVVSISIITSNSTNTEGSDDAGSIVNSFPMSEITSENIDAIYEEYDSFAVNSVSDLNKLSDMVNRVYKNVMYDFSGKTVYLNKDLDYSGQGYYKPIGKHISLDNVTVFCGVFDGNNHTISNIVVNNVLGGGHETLQYKYAGLFGCVSGGLIKNIIVSDSEIYGRNYVGAIVGECSNGALVYNCVNKNTRVIVENSDSAYNISICAGGIVGSATKISGMTLDADLMLRCNGSVEVVKVHTGSSMYVGGILGSLDTSNNCILRNSHFEGNISVDVSTTINTAEIGGIIGSDNNIAVLTSSKLLNCYNIGSISVKIDNVATARIGGLIGDCHSKVSESYNAGKMYVELGKNTNITTIGGVIGTAMDEVSNSYNSEVMTIVIDIKGYDTYIGGVVGMTSSSIYECSNEADVACNIVSSYTSGLNVAGIVGYSKPTTGSTYVKNCYNMGDIYLILPIVTENASSINVAGIVGYSVTTITNCYSVANNISYHESTKYHTNAGGIVGKANKTVFSGSLSNSYCGFLTDKVVNNNSCGCDQGNGNVSISCNNYSSEHLKSKEFLAILNTGSTVWTINEKINGGYPIIASDLYATLKLDINTSTLVVTVLNQKGSILKYTWQKYDRTTGIWTTIVENTTGMYRISVDGTYRALIMNEVSSGMSYVTVTNEVNTIEYITLNGLVKGLSRSVVSSLEDACVKIVVTVGDAKYEYKCYTTSDGYYRFDIPKTYLTSYDNILTVSCMGYETYVEENYRPDSENVSVIDRNFGLNVATDPEIEYSEYNFDKNERLVSDLKIRFDLGSFNKISSIACDSNAIPFTVTGTTVTIASVDLMSYSVGNHTLALYFDETKHVDASLTITESVSPTITTNSDYDKNDKKDVILDINMGSGLLQAGSLSINTIDGIAVSDIVFSENNKITIKSGYLSSLPLGVASFKASFKGTYNTNIDFTIAITDSSSNILSLNTTIVDLTSGSGDLSIFIPSNWGSDDKFVISNSSEHKTSLSIVTNMSVSGNVCTLTLTLKDGSTPKTLMYLWYDNTYIGSFNCILNETETNVDIIDITIPVTGGTPDTSGTISNGRGKISSITWYPADSTFKNNTEYTVTVILSPEVRHIYSDSTHVTIDGFDTKVELVNDGKLSTSYTFSTSQKAITYTDTDATSGTAPASQSAYNGSIVTIKGSGDLARTGFVFICWSYDNGTKYLNANDKFTVEESIELTPVWGYSVTYNLTNCTAPEIKFVMRGGEFTTVLSFPTGYHAKSVDVTVKMGDASITGAYNEVDGTITIDNVSGNISIAAKATTKTYQIKLEHYEPPTDGDKCEGLVTFKYRIDNGTEEVVGNDCTVSVQYGQSLVVVANPPDGHVVDRWDDGTLSNTRSVGFVDKDETWTVTITNKTIIILDLTLDGSQFNDCDYTFMLSNANAEAITSTASGGKVIFNASIFTDYYLYVTLSGESRDTLINIEAQETTYSRNIEFFTVKFDYNYNSTENTPRIDTYTVVEGMPIVLPGATRSGYVFNGWYSDQGLTEKWNVNMEILCTTTIYAKWTEGQTIALDAEGGNVSPGSILRIPGDMYGDLPIPKYDGHIFTGWYVVRDNVNTLISSTSIVESADTTLIALWDAKEYSIEYDLSYASWAEGYNPVSSYMYGFPVDLPTAASIKGMTFSYWYLYDGSDQNNIQKFEGITKTTSGDLKLIAVYTGMSIEVKVDDQVYNGNEQYAIPNSVIIDGKYIVDLKNTLNLDITYKANESSGASLTVSGFPLTAGTYDVSVKILSGCCLGSSTDKEIKPIQMVIEKRQLTVDIQNNVKTYDGTDGFSAFTVKNNVDGDKLIVSAKCDKVNVGDNVNITFAISGEKASNYIAPKSVAGSINPVIINNMNAVSRPYDGNNTYDVAVNGINSEKVVITYTSSKNAGSYAFNATNGFTVVIKGVSGGDADNYRIGTLFGTYTITQKSATIVATAVDREYDNTKVVIVNTKLTGIVSGDDVSILSSVNGTISSENASDGKYSVTIENITPTGNDKGNYTFTQPSSIQVSISKSKVSIAENGSYISRTYDGTRSTTGMNLSSSYTVSATNKLLPSVSYTATFTDKNVGYRQINLTFTLDDPTNYELVNNTLTINAAITKLKLTVTPTESWSKVFDGTTVAPVFSLSNIVSGDTVSVSGNYDTIDVGTGKTIAFTNLTGASSSNYSLPGDITGAEITKATLSAPDNLLWDAGIAKWNSVSIAGCVVKYEVILYLGTDKKCTVASDKNSYDFTDKMKEIKGVYHFTVQAISESNNVNSSSVSAQSVSKSVFEVTFDYNKNKDNVSKFVIDGTPVDKPEDVSIPGHIFMGWYTDQTYGKSWDFSNEITGDTTIYSQWSIKAPEITSQPSSYSGSYNGADHTLSVTATVDKGSEITLSYQWCKNGESIEGATNSEFNVKNVSDSGNYYVIVTAKHDNSASITSSAVTVFIKVAGNKWTTEPACPSITYGGSINSTGVSQFGEALFTYYIDESCSVETTKSNSGADSEGSAPKWAGTYYMHAFVNGTDDYTALDKVVGFTINKKQMDLAWSNTSLTYNGSEQEPSVSAETGVGGEISTFTISGGEKDVGTYTATASLLINGFTDGSKNYSYGPNCNYTILQYEITIGDITREFDKNSTYTFTVNGVNSEKIEVSYTTGSADVGSYASYEKKYDAPNYKLTFSNYTITKAIGIVSIPNITEITDISITVGDTDHNGDGAIKYGYKLKSASEISWLNSSKITGLTPNVTYDIFVKQEGTNNCGEATSSAVEVTTIKSTLTILKLDGSLVFGQTLIASFTENDVTAAKYEWYYGDTINTAITKITDATSNTYTLDEKTVGKYVKVVATGTGSYTGVTSVTTFSSISKAETSGIMSDFTSTYDGDIKTLTATFTGSKGNITYTYYVDSEYTTKTTPSANGSLQIGSAPSFAGKYFVKASVVADSCYKSAETTGTLTINKATLSTPTDLKWDLYAASWSAVKAIGDTNVTYFVKLVHGGSETQFTTSVCMINLKDELIKYAGDYSFVVTAISDNGNVNESSSANSGSNTVYAVTLVDDHGSGTIQNIALGGLVVKPINPTTPGHSFGGWYKEKECTIAWDFSTKITETTFIYAKWTMDAPYITSQPSPVNITYDGVSHDLSVTAGHAYDGATISYQWYKNSEPITGATALTYSVNDVSDSGSYYVIVTATHGDSSKNTTSDKISVSITRFQLTATVNSSWSKVFDDSVVFTGFTINAFSGDKITCNAEYTSVDIGFNKTINFTISGEDAPNYLAPSSVIGAITVKEISVTLNNGGEKIYDGTDTCSIIGHDAPSGITVTAKYAESDVGSEIQILFTISGTNSENYSIGSMTGTIKQYVIENVGSQSSTYNGTAIHAITVNGVLNEKVILTYTMDSSNAGTYTKDMFEVTTDNSNYSVDTSKFGNFEIIKKNLTVIDAYAVGHPYNEKTDVEIKNAKLNGLLPSDVNKIKITGINGIISNASAGPHDVTVSVIINDNTNYTVTAPTGINVTISKAIVTISANSNVGAINKTYDGNTTANVDKSYYTIKSNGSGPSVTVTSKYNSKDVMDANKIIVSFTLGDTSNYEFDSNVNTIEFNGSIFRLKLTVSDVDWTKTYDGTTEFTGFIYTNIVPKDVVSVSAYYNDANVANANLITFRNLQGENSGNYSLPDSVSGHISNAQASLDRDLIVTYDGNPYFTTTVNVVGGTATLYLTTESKNVGDKIKITSLEVGDLPNYEGSALINDHIVKITEATINADEYNVVYNGENTFTRQIAGLNDEIVTVTYGLYSANVGIYSYTINTASSTEYKATIDNTNYRLYSPGDVVVSKAPLTITVNESKYHDGSVWSHVADSNNIVGLFGQDSVSGTLKTAGSASKVYDTVSEFDVSSVVLSSPDNYEFASVDGSVTILGVELTGISITNAPTKTEYAVGESFNPSGMVVTASYNDGTSSNVTNYSFSPSGALKLNDDTVTVSYTSGSITKTANIGISVHSSGEFIVSLLSTPSNGGTVSGAGTYSGGSEITVSATASAGYIFVSWSDGGSASHRITVNGDVTLTATFAKYEGHTLSLTSTPAIGGSVTGGGRYMTGETVTVTATPSAGYRFVSWSDGGSASHAVTVDSDMVLTAIFSKTEYTITATSSSNGFISPGTSVVSYGNSIVFTMNPNAGYMIDHVIVDGMDVGFVNAFTFRNVTSDHTIYVSFKSGSYSIIASASEGGSISPSGTNNVVYRSDVTYTIFPNDENRIKDVLIDGISAGVIDSYTFHAIDRNHTISVSFVTSDDDKVINVVVNDGSEPNSDVKVNGTEVINGSISVKNDNENVLSIVPNDGFYVAEVVVNGVNAELSGDPESHVDIKLDSSTDKDVIVKTEAIYGPYVRADSDFVITGDEIRYDSSISLTKIDVDSNDWNIIWGGYEGYGKNAYEAKLVTPGDTMPSYGTLTVSINVGSQYNGKMITVFHKDLDTGSIEEFDVIVENGNATVSVDSLSPFLVLLPSDSGMNMMYIVAAIAVVVLMIIVILAYRHRKEMNA